LEEEAKKEGKKKKKNHCFYFFLLILIRERKKERKSQGIYLSRGKGQKTPELVLNQNSVSFGLQKLDEKE
jgi:hypothetical protein